MPQDKALVDFSVKNAGRSEFIETLEEFGLTAHEASVYLSALSLGASSVQKIASEAGIKRTTVYSIIESLQAQGLLSIQSRGFKRLFVAEPPRRLAALLERRKNKLLEVLPDLEAIHNIGGRDSFIRHYEGIEGMKACYDGMVADVRPGEDYVVMSSYDEWFRLAPDFWPDFVERRSKTGANIKMLSVDSPLSRQRAAALKKNESMRFLPPGYVLRTNLVVIPRKALIHQLVPPVITLIIENPNVVLMHQQMHRLLWEQARKMP